MTLSTAETALIATAQNILDSLPPANSTNSITDRSVGSATLCSDGRTFTGINIFHFTGGPCAENAAIANATAAGVSSAINPVIGDDVPTLTHIVAVGNGGRGVISPCGRCRQQLLDYYPEILVIVNDGEKLRAVDIKELLPFAYRIRNFDAGGAKPVGDEAVVMS